MLAAIALAYGQPTHNGIFRHFNKTLIKTQRQRLKIDQRNNYFTIYAVIDPQLVDKLER